MNHPRASRKASSRSRQGGFTLIELIIATAIGLMVMGALTSVVLTTVLADNVATGRVEASAQIRNFQLMAYDDFALSQPPSPTGCGTPAIPCTTQPMNLAGMRMPNQVAGAAVPFSVAYTWNPAAQSVTRTTGGNGQVAAGNVTAFSWFVDTGGAHPAVVVALTVTVADYNATFSESQSLLFYPRVAAP